MTLREEYEKETGVPATEEMHLPTLIKTVCTEEYVEWLERELQEIKDIEDLP